MSGDMNTALGNCLLMCMLIMTYLNSKLIKYDYINNGDDAVLFIEKEHLHLLRDLPEWFERMGFEMVVEEPVYQLENIEFCQMRPINLGYKDYTMVRNYPSSLAKDLTCLEPTAFKAWLHSVGQGGQSVTTGVPIYWAFYKALERMGKSNGKEYVGYMADSGFHRMIELGAKQRTLITADARVSFWRAFGVSPDVQISIEQRFETCELDEAITSDPQGKFITNLLY